MPKSDDLSKLLNAVLSSPKYRHIHPPFVERIAHQENAKGRRHKDTLKAVKNKLHQVGGAYLQSEMSYVQGLEELCDAINNPNSLKDSCKHIMGQHASTSERLPILEEFYSTIFAELPPINSVLDLACGFNPLAIPWMPLATKASYTACDIYSDMTSFISSFLSLTPVSGETFTCDVISAPPTQKVDLALILKTIPCLEQVDKQVGPRLLDEINADYLLVSYPLRSLGGKQKGMLEHYETSFQEMIEGRGWEIKKLVFETELAFLVKK